ncbi:MAG: hypothetical protein GKR87_05010 [Kiritimatiellae bacterium]|nr:hypothetical protein [Kiritimatiellia bacterium]
MNFSYLSFAALTDVGVKRSSNQDAILPLPQYSVYCPADGMGGVQGGEEASQNTVELMEKSFEDLDGSDLLGDVMAKSQVVQKAADSASQRIKQRSDEQGIIVE